MSKINKPKNKAMVFDPTTGKIVEAATTDIDEMARRERLKAKEAVAKAEELRLAREEKKAKKEK